MSNEKMRAAAWLVVLTGGVAFAQDKPVEKDPMSGPAVKDTSVPGDRPSFGGGLNADRRERPIPHHIFLRSVLSLNSPDAPEAVRATPELADDLREIERVYREEVKAYVQQHDAEIKEIRGKVGGKERARLDQFLRGAEGKAGEGAPAQGEKPAGRRGEGKEGNGPEAKVNEQDRAAAIEQIKTLMGNAPKPADAHAQMMSLLSDAQQQFVKEQMEKRTEQWDRRGSGDNEQIEGQSPKGEGPGAARPGKEGQAAPRTPEERKKFREAMRKRAEQRGANQNGQSARGKDDE